MLNAFIPFILLPKITLDILSSLFTYITLQKDKSKWTLIPIYKSWYAKYMNYDAVVIYPFVLFKNDMNNIMPSHIKHEMVHVKQMEDMGYFNFFEDYDNETDKNGYWKNKYEIEAFTKEKLPLTQKELERLHLPVDFPKTDIEKNKRKNGKKSDIKKTTRKSKYTKNYGFKKYSIKASTKTK